MRSPDPFHRAEGLHEPREPLPQTRDEQGQLYHGEEWSRQELSHSGHQTLIRILAISPRGANPVKLWVHKKW